MTLAHIAAGDGIKGLVRRQRQRPIVWCDVMGVPRDRARGRLGVAILQNTWYVFCRMPMYSAEYIFHKLAVTDPPPLNPQ